MAAGISVGYDKYGLQTAALVCGVGAWPSRFAEAPPRGLADTGTTASAIGANIPSHACSRFEVPTIPAGQSHRVGSYYHRTGCLQSRVEEGFRETKGSCILTETPMPNYGTIRKAGTLLLNSGMASTPREHLPMSARGSGAVTGAKHASAAGVEQKAPKSARAPRGASSEYSCKSNSRSAPTWAKQNNNRHAWKLEPLPFYDRQSDGIGSHYTSKEPAGRRPAGKSESGFMSPLELIATLTKPENQ
eukprot:TRINITY_DN354_c2_g1_i1.p1 TRINITY_DN354_c2_g1~~TRINITY_DN354_c2_g1_i1.p1  ORF type:complete len:270 (-),score=10.59 TRINITY_DN354_c2_g1_i1:27-764(-)